MDFINNDEIIVKSKDTTFEITGGLDSDITNGDFDHTFSLLQGVSFTKTNR